MTHTPAPWRVSNDGNGEQEWRINAPNGDPTLTMSAWDSLAVVYGNDDEPSLGSIVGEANARLIASAPDLLEALETLRQHTWLIIGVNHSATVLADAAIARARGESA